MKNAKGYISLAVLSCCTALTARAHGAVLITINDSNPAAVTFTATGNAPGVTDASHLFSQGLGFAGFFAANPSLGFFPTVTATSTSLTTGVDGTPDYTGAQSASFSGSSTDDLELFAGSGNTEHFSTGSSAFTGTATFNFASSTFFSPNLLPAAGTTGQLVSGDGASFIPFQTAPVVLGTYQVAAVPEPSQASLILLGAAALTFTRLRRGGRVSVR